MALGDLIAPYFTVRVPWVPDAFATRWHPTTATGPFATLDRGAFQTLDLALAWGREHLAGMPYTVVRFDASDWIGDEIGGES